jgi:hypothetical protein
MDMNMNMDMNVLMPKLVYSGGVCTEYGTVYEDRRCDR